jgi:hypothetical protein
VPMMINNFFIAGSFSLFFWSTGWPQMHLLRRVPEVLRIIHPGSR